MMMPARGGKKILVVEDDAATREAMVTILQREGYRVLQAEDGQEAFNRLREEGPFDLILLDILLPALDGRRFLEWRQRDPTFATTPVLIVSGVGTEIPGWAASLGACGFLAKPVEVADLLTEIRRCVG